VTAVPPDVERLLAEREQARKTKDFALADSIRDQIAELGFDVKDTPEGATVSPRETFATIDPSRIESVLDSAPDVDFSVHLLHEGFLDDVDRFLNALERHSAAQSYEVVLVDNASGDGEELSKRASDRVCVLHLDRTLGWAQARNAGLKTSRGRVVILADLSVEPTGDVLAPLGEALSDPEVGVAGPWGIVSDDLREFRESAGPEVDAIEGYLLATRRELIAQGLVHEKFRWYRHADIDLSFQIRALGTKALVAAAPAERHIHRGWDALDEEERAKRSKRNWYVFLDRWKQHHGMLLSHRD
jgi:GT2 family glycosyltransferase